MIKFKECFLISLLGTFNSVALGHGYSSIFEPSTGLLTIQDLDDKSGKHYHVELQDQGNFNFVIKQVKPLNVQDKIQRQKQLAADKSAIRDARRTQTQALAKEDVALVASYWTDDITIRRALGGAISGKVEAISAITPQGDPATRILFLREAVDITVSSNWPLAYEEGTWTGQVGGIDGPVVIEGRYSAQWVKRNDKWFIRSEVFVALTCDDVGCNLQALP